MTCWYIDTLFSICWYIDVSIWCCGYVDVLICCYMQLYVCIGSWHIDILIPLALSMPISLSRLVFTITITVTSAWRLTLHTSGSSRIGTCNKQAWQRVPCWRVVLQHFSRPSVMASLDSMYVCSGTLIACKCNEMPDATQANRLKYTQPMQVWGRLMLISPCDCTPQWPLHGRGLKRTLDAITETEQQRLRIHWQIDVLAS